jgi:hypothetical protein
MARLTILRTIDDEALFKQLQALVNTMPDFQVLNDDARRWLGRLSAMLGETGSVADQVALTTHTSRMQQPSLRAFSTAEVKNILFRALAFAELGAPSTAQGAFIAAGNEFDAYSAVSKILAEANKNVLLVDPYMDAAVLTDFAVLAPEGVSLMLLTEEAAVKPSLAAAIPRWLKQQGGARPLEVRVASTKPSRSFNTDRRERCLDLNTIIQGSGCAFSGIIVAIRW